MPIDVRDNRGETPLHRAAFGARLPVAKLLADLGADLDAENHYGTTPLAYARQASVARFLEEKSAKSPEVPDSLDLRRAAISNDEIQLARLVEACRDPEAFLDPYTRPMDVALGTGSNTLTRLLLARGASAEGPPDETGRLYRTADDGYREAARLLLDHGADPNKRDPSGKGPLHAAAAKGHLGIVEDLLGAGADPAVEDRAGHRPIDLARRNLHDDVVALLERHGSAPPGSGS